MSRAAEVRERLSMSCAPCRGEPTGSVLCVHRQCNVCTQQDTPLVPAVAGARGPRQGMQARQALKTRWHCAVMGVRRKVLSASCWCARRRRSCPIIKFECAVRMNWTSARENPELELHRTLMAHKSRSSMSVYLQVNCANALYAHGLRIHVRALPQICERKSPPWASLLVSLADASSVWSFAFAISVGTQVANPFGIAECSAGRIRGKTPPP